MEFPYVHTRTLHHLSLTLLVQQNTSVLASWRPGVLPLPTFPITINSCYDHAIFLRNQPDFATIYTLIAQNFNLSYQISPFNQQFSPDLERNFHVNARTPHRFLVYIGGRYIDFQCTQKDARWNFPMHIQGRYIISA